MPFTLSHPAAALPLRRLLPWAPLTALAIGSMTPDFPYFVGWDELRFRTHSLPSVAAYSVPVGLVTYFAYERWLRAAWCDLLPAAVAARVPRSATHSRWLAVSGALALGALTHVLWDSFTHEHQPGVELVRALNVVIVELLGFPVRGYNLLQHGSTLVGLALLARWFHCWLRRTPGGELPASWRRASASARTAAGVRCARAGGARPCTPFRAAGCRSRLAAQLRRQRGRERDEPHARVTTRIRSLVVARRRRRLAFRRAPCTRPMTTTSRNATAGSSP